MFKIAAVLQISMITLKSVSMALCYLFFVIVSIYAVIVVGFITLCNSCFVNLQLHFPFDNTAEENFFQPIYFTSIMSCTTWESP